jgi:hypothetical protein
MRVSVQVKIQLPQPFDKQLQVMNAASRHNVVAGGRFSGKTALGIDVLLTSPMGALRGLPVAWIAADKERLSRARREILRAVDPLVVARGKSRRVELRTKGRIDFYSADETVLELLEQYALVVIDDAHLIDRLYDLWESDVLLSLSRYRGHAWVLGKPQGTRGGFWRLFCEAVGEYASQHTIRTLENPHADRADVAHARSTLPEAMFRQDYEAEFTSEVLELSEGQLVIGRDETFRQWCNRLADGGLKVDGHPFKLDDRPSMHFIYDLIPSTAEEAFGRIDVIMKCTQVGFTVMEMLAMIYLALKFMPCKIGMYLPDMKLAAVKSSERFMPIARTIPDAYRLMVDDHSGRKGGEGNVLVRNMGGSRFHFLWTSGKAMTESIPLDIVSFDEVQEMAVADMEKTRERMSASRIRYTLMGSTAKWPDRDIHFWFKRGTQCEFHTRCPSCGESQVLVKHFPACIKYDAESRDYRYVCHACGGWIDDTQSGEWVESEPGQTIRSVHYPQFLSPTISAREIIEAYHNADDMMNFYNRKLGMPYTDQSQVPINIEILNACADLGMSLGVVWKDRGSETFMGIDQMGAFNVVLIAERLQTGHMALIHAEEIYDPDPFARCDVLMSQFGVAVCVVETLPNYNDAKRFAGRHEGRVFLAGYGNMADEMMRWGDAATTKQERKTAEEDRDRYTVTLDQYKTMQVALSRIQKKVCVFPDPSGLVQEIVEKGQRRMVEVLKDRVFLHLTRTALVAEQDEEEKKFRRRVVKVGIDPHFSYAFMLLNVAWARAHGTSTFIYPSDPAAPDVRAVVERTMPGLPSEVLGLIAPASPGTCGSCAAMGEDGLCSARYFRVSRNDPACEVFVARDEVSLS